MSALLRHRDAERERFRRLTPDELAVLESMIVLYGAERTAKHCGIGLPSLERVRATGRVHVATIVLARDGLERWVKARGAVQ